MTTAVIIARIDGYLHHPPNYLCKSQSIHLMMIKHVYLTHTVQLVVQNLPDVYVEKMLPFLAEMLDTSSHFQFYLRWCTVLLSTCGVMLKQRAPTLMAAVRDLQKSIIQKKSELGKM